MLEFETCKAYHPCLLCHTRKAQLVATRCRNGELLRTIVCLGCGLGRRDPMPTVKELLAYYSQDYRVDIGKGRKPTKRRLWRISTGALTRVQDQLAHGVSGSTLDFGCGASEMVYLQARAGLKSRGFDPDSSHIAWAQSTLGVNVEQQSYTSIQVQPGSVDLVTLYHVLEHIPDPVDALYSCHQWLRPGGQLIVEVPNIQSVQQGPGHQFIKAHLYYFHLQALVELARCSGFLCTESGVFDHQENIRCYFTKVCIVPAKDAEQNWMWEGMCSTRTALEAHTPLDHYTSLIPYRRIWDKLSRNIVEVVHTLGKNELAILNSHAQKLSR